MLLEISKSDLTYLRLYSNAKSTSFGYEFQDGVVLAKESSKILIIKIMKNMKIFSYFSEK